MTLWQFCPPRIHTDKHGYLCLLLPFNFLALRGGVVVDEGAENRLEEVRFEERQRRKTEPQRTQKRGLLCVWGGESLRYISWEGMGIPHLTAGLALEGESFK
jgi:hypothetical protein